MDVQGNGTLGAEQGKSGGGGPISNFLAVKVGRSEEPWFKRIAKKRFKAGTFRTELESSFHLETLKEMRGPPQKSVVHGFRRGLREER